MLRRAGGGAAVSSSLPWHDSTSDHISEHFSGVFLCWSNIYQPHSTGNGFLCFGFCLHPLNSKFTLMFWIHLSSVGSPPQKSVWAQQRSRFSSREILLPCESSSTLNKIFNFFNKLSWAFSGIKTSRLGNVPHLANLNSTSGNLLEQKDGRGGGNIILCLIGFD